jgi:hypothetical protein
VAPGCPRDEPGRSHARAVPFLDLASWPPGAAAVFLAACVSAVVSVVSVWVTVVEGRRSRRRLDAATVREQWWTRWSWTLERCLALSADQQRTGAAMMRVLLASPWATRDDEEIALVIGTEMARMGLHDDHHPEEGTP